MCGIAGIVGQNWTRGQLEAMVAVQHHRGPDHSGIYINEGATVGLGHNRLSIIDLSSDGHQPMANADGSLWIVFNGEIYNYLELRAELNDYRYHSHTDTEVILAAYERWGEQCVEHFIGMFAFAIWDARQQHLWCARDRLGIKPFYYAMENGRLMFASEIKALLAAGWPTRVNERVIYDYLVHGLYEHSCETFFDGAYALEPGHTLVWNSKGIQVRHYWELSAHIASCPQPKRPPNAWCDQLEALLIDSVKLRLRSDVPLGIHLTGGLDSSALLAFLDDAMPQGGRLEAFTGVYGDNRYDEAVYSREVTRSLAVGLNQCRLDVKNFWDIAVRAQWHQEQPFGGVATLVYWSMEAAAREHGIIVLLEGQGGDELFGGYSYYIGDYITDVQDTDAGTLQSVVKQSSLLGDCSPEVMLERIRHMRSNAGRCYQDGTAYLRPDCLSESFLARGGTQTAFPTPSQSAFTNSRFRDLRYTKLPRVLRFNDRMSMAYGCELRVPFLDHRIVEFAFTLPNDLMFHQGLSKWPLRCAVGSRLPSSVRLAPKRAVVTPQREWIRNDLRPEIEERLSRSELVKRGYLDRLRMLRAFRDFCEHKKGDNAFFIWQWLNLDLWFEVFNPA
jgi:asparagine synthase (glutamine-hydrolysing)